MLCCTLKQCVADLHNNNKKKSLQLLKHAGCGEQLHLLLYVVILPLFNRKLSFEIKTVKWKELQTEQSAAY